MHFECNDVEIVQLYNCRYMVKINKIDFPFCHHNLSTQLSYILKRTQNGSVSSDFHKNEIKLCKLHLKRTFKKITKYIISMTSHTVNSFKFFTFTSICNWTRSTLTNYTVFFFLRSQVLVFSTISTNGSGKLISNLQILNKCVHIL